MSEFVEQRIWKLRHDLANPLAVILAETQLLLLDADSYSEDTVNSLREIENRARSMRDMIQAA